jgi:hypothetical protein
MTKERFLLIPYSILNLSGIGLAAGAISTASGPRAVLRSGAVAPFLLLTMAIVVFLLFF